MRGIKKHIAPFFVLLAFGLVLGHSLMPHSHGSPEGAGLHAVQQSDSHWLHQLFSMDLGEEHLEHFTGNDEEMVSDEAGEVQGSFILLTHSVLFDFSSPTLFRFLLKEDRISLRLSSCLQLRGPPASC